MGWMKRTSLLVVVLLALPGCDDSVSFQEDPSAPPQLRWVDVPQEGGGFGVPVDWESTTGSGMHFAMLAAASDPTLVDDLVTSYNDNGVSIRAVSLYELEADDAFVDMTVSIMLAFPDRHDLLPRVVAADDFHPAEEHHGVPVHEISGWRSRDQNVTVRYWIGPDATEETRAQLERILERIELP